MSGNSSHNTVNPFQEEFNSYKEFTNAQLLLINGKIDKCIDSVAEVLRPRNQRRQQEDENPFGNKGKGRSRASVRDFADKGLLRPPPGVTLRRPTPRGQDSEEYDGEYVEDEDEEGSEENGDDLRYLKLAFPAFVEGDEAVEWVRDCGEYFSIYGVKNHRKVAIAAMHLRGVPKSWYKSYKVEKGVISWEEFSEDFIIRFGETGTEDLFEQFKMLKQTQSLTTYYDEFEKFKGRLKEKVPQLLEEFFVENFLGGLREDTKKMVKLLEPQTLTQAYKLAKAYEVPISRAYPRNSPNPNPNFQKMPPTYSRSPAQKAGPITSTIQPPLLTYPKI